MSEELKPTAEHPAQRKRTVAIYLAILFAVAFLLLLLAYFMQQRSSQTMLSALQNSANNAQVLNEMIDENRALNDEIDRLEDSLTEAFALVEETRTQLAQAQAVANASQLAALQEQNQLFDQLEAILLLEKLEYLVATGQDEPARQQLDPHWGELLDQISNQHLVPGQPSLTQRYQALEETLFPSEAAD